MFRIIKEFPEYEINENGIVRIIKTGRIKKIGIITYKKSGYKTEKLNLSKDKKIYTKKIHRLLAITFIPNPDNLPQVDHIDGDSLNNTVSNLRWCNRNDNAQNKSVQTNNKIGIKNICYCKATNRYIFHKQVNCVEICKYFKTLEEAIDFKEKWYANNFNEFNRRE